MERTVEETAEVLKRHPQTVRKLIRDGELRCRQAVPGGRILVPDDAIAEYLASIDGYKPPTIAVAAPESSPGSGDRRPARRRPARKAS